MPDEKKKKPGSSKAKAVELRHLSLRHEPPRRALALAVVAAKRAAKAADNDLRRDDARYKRVCPCGGCRLVGR